MLIYDCSHPHSIPPSASHLKCSFRLWDSPVVDREHKLLHGTYGLCSWLLSSESTELSAACWVLTVTQPTLRPSVGSPETHCFQVFKEISVQVLDGWWAPWTETLAPLCRKEKIYTKDTRETNIKTTADSNTVSPEDGASDSQSGHVVSFNRIHFW